MKLTLYQTREEWLSQRGIGASEVAAILGLSSYAKPFDIYARHKLGHTTPDNDDMARGRRREHAVITLYEDRESVDVMTPRALGVVAWRATMGGSPWATCSPDGLVVDLDATTLYDETGATLTPLYGVEAKASRVPKEWGDECDILPGGETLPIPEAYYVQCLWSLLVTGLERWDLIADVLGEERVYRIHADHARQAVLFSKVSAWRDRYLLGDAVPPVDGSDGADVWLRWKYPTGANRREATTEEKMLAIGYAHHRDEEAKHEAEKKLAGQKIRALAGDLDGLDLPNGRVSIVRARGKTTLDQKRLQADEPELCRRYARVGEPSHSIRVTINEE